MNIHEHQAKQILKKYGVAVPNGVFGFSADDVVEFYRVSMRDEGWSEISIVRSDFILLNFDKQDRFATIKVNRRMFESSSSEITIGPKTDTTINRSLNIQPNDSSSDPFTIE